VVLLVSAELLVAWVLWLVAAELKVSRQQVAKLRQRDDFPLPVATLTVGDVWDLNVIHRWAGSGLRRAVGRPPANTERLAAGRRFEFGAEIGGGGFAEVYSAQDLGSPSGTQVAVKVLRQVHAVDPQIVARFERELRLMSELRDPNVMPVLASGTDEKLGLWYAMPIARGSLADELGNMEQGHITAARRRRRLGRAAPDFPLREPADEGGKPGFAGHVSGVTDGLWSILPTSSARVLPYKLGGAPCCALNPSPYSTGRMDQPG